MKKLNPILGLVFTMACLATAQANVVLAGAFCLVGMFFLLRG